MRVSKEGSTQESHNVSGRLSDRELPQILGARSSWSEKELRVTHTALQSAEIRGLPGTGNEDVNILIDAGAKTFRQSIGRDDVVLLENHDERVPRSPAQRRLPVGVLTAGESRPVVDVARFARRFGIILHRLWNSNVGIAGMVRTSTEKH
jgi:hypothetical protein